MPGLLRLESRPPDFTLGWDDKPRAALSRYLRRKRIALLFLPKSGVAEAQSFRAFYGSAVVQQGGLQARDIVVLVIARSVDDIPFGKTMAKGAEVFLLNDADGAVTAKYGGAPAFYLVGKDGGIKEARRKCPTLAELFGTIDKMPMRRQEMRERGR